MKFPDKPSSQGWFNVGSIHDLHHIWGPLPAFDSCTMNSIGLRIWEKNIW
jgi:hypothetical protein